MTHDQSSATMSMTLKDRAYGLAVGGAIADAMGAVVTYAPDIDISNPYQSEDVGISPGYWTEPTTLWLYRITRDPCVGEQDPEPEQRRRDQILKEISCTGVVSFRPDPSLEDKILEKLAQVSAFSLRYYKDFQGLLSISYNHGLSVSISCAEICKLFASIIDTTLHGGHKRTILAPKTYYNIEVSESSWSMFDDQPETEIAAILQNILHCFNRTNNFTDGLKAVIDTSLKPAWSCALYGQLAGAYYGLTDINIEWMNCVQKSELLIDSVDNVWSMGGAW